MSDEAEDKDKSYHDGQISINKENPIVYVQLVLSQLTVILQVNSSRFIETLGGDFAH